MSKLKCGLTQRENKFFTGGVHIRASDQLVNESADLSALRLENTALIRLRSSLGRGGASNSSLGYLHLAQNSKPYIHSYIQKYYQTIIICSQK